MNKAEKLIRIKEIKERYGWTNKDLAEKLHSTEQSIKNVLAPNSQKPIPKWMNAIIMMDEAARNEKQSTENLKELIEAIEKQIEDPKEKAGQLLSDFETLIGSKERAKDLVNKTIRHALKQSNLVITYAGKDANYWAYVYGYANGK